ncbi:PDDEXK-like family protein [Staphylococcus arlettae]|uniref:PDDEXK-like family protein n=1 Tax=Staphylococcus arlettae TaxID=29378 RepID=UPI002DBDB0E4|nr:PD-(D/E)XK nuclease family protein [Staphylococcus arlettae]MEB5899562.1 PD-(D/E)XK nuclease family protein [Staphylococcus arlettae]
MNNDEKLLIEFIKDVDRLNEIESNIDNFNVFEILGTVNTEIRHSNMLAWLFNPNEVHELKDLFIKKFIEVYLNKVTVQKDDSFILKMLLRDFDDVTVRREWNHIDILLISEANKVVIAIENKIWSKESKGQLKRYQSVLESEFLNYEKIYCFLTPEAGDSSNTEVWTSMSYIDVITCLETIVALKKDTINPKVSSFINQYIDILRRYIVKDENLEKLCTEIYFKHKRALDLIFEYKPDIHNDISNKIQSIIKEDDNLILDDSSKSLIRFTTQKLDEKMGRNHYDSKWTSSNRYLLFEIRNNYDRKSLHLLIGPSDETTRKNLHAKALAHPNVFKKVKKTMTPVYNSIFTKELYANNKHLEYEDVIRAVENKFHEFLTQDLPKIESVLLSEEQSSISIN